MRTPPSAPPNSPQAMHRLRPKSRLYLDLTPSSRLEASTHFWCKYYTACATCGCSLWRGCLLVWSNVWTFVGCYSSASLSPADEPEETATAVAWLCPDVRGLDEVPRFADFRWRPAGPDDGLMPTRSRNCSLLHWLVTTLVLSRPGRNACALNAPWLSDDSS